VAELCQIQRGLGHTMHRLQHRGAARMSWRCRRHLRSRPSTPLSHINACRHPAGKSECERARGPVVVLAAARSTSCSDGKIVQRKASDSLNKDKGKQSRLRQDKHETGQPLSSTIAAPRATEAKETRQTLRHRLGGQTDRCCRRCPRRCLQTSRALRQRLPVTPWCPAARAVSQAESV
jgi:hypothetical protein